MRTDFSTTFKPDSDRIIDFGFRVVTLKSPVWSVRGPRSRENAGADGAGTGTYERWEAQFVPWLSVVPGSHDRCPCPRSPQIAVHERKRGRFCDGMRGRIDKPDEKGIARARCEDVVQLSELLH